MNDDLTRIAITWKHTGDAEFPYTAEVGGRTFTIRLNDFPAEPLYTVLSEGVELVDLDDWPPTWDMPSPPEELLRLLAPRNTPRHEGAVRLEATSEPGESVESLAVVADEVVAGGAQERILLVAPEQGVAISAFASEGGDEIRLHWLRAGKMQRLAVGQRTTLAAAISPDGKGALVLDEEGGVLFYDLSSGAYPSAASARKPERGKRVALDLARGGRLWLAASGPSIEVRMMNDRGAVATVDLGPLGGDVTSARFLPDGRGFLVGTPRGVVMRFALLIDRVGSSRDARVAAIADAVDAALAGTRWGRYDPRVDVYDEKTEGGRTTLYFVADHYEYNHAQSGSDWAEHDLCAGRATFEGDRCVEAHVASVERRRLTEREDESYDVDAARRAFRPTKPDT